LLASGSDDKVNWEEIFFKENKKLFFFIFLRLAFKIERAFVSIMIFYGFNAIPGTVPAYTFCFIQTADAG
jgi:hypothetical protein